jgi:hypothetical protein
MRRTEFLLTEIRNSTDNTDTNAIKDAELIAYLNYGQKLIQNIVFAANIKSDIFKQTEVYEANESGVYDLPNDIYAVNSISLVEGRFGLDNVNSGFRPIERVDKSEAANMFGYYTEDNQLVLTGLNINLQVVQLRVTYFRVLPRMDKRWGQINTVNSGVSLVMETGYDSNASTVDDYVSVVNKFGAQVLGGIFIDDFNGATWETTDTLTGVVAGQYVCMGKNSVNASLLPDECETYLLDYARQRVYTRNVYDDANKQVYFTDQQKTDIAALFSNNQKDIIYPPITDTEYLEF